MADGWEDSLSRWRDAGLLDASTAARIREFETSHQTHGRLRWPVLLALAFGALLLGAGVLLFIAAHWNQLSPSSRFCLVLLMVAGFHLVAAFSQRAFPAMATALHGLGTVALGAGIYLCGQIFNLDAPWPNGVFLWALGAWIGWFLLKDWVQLLFVSLLTPAWISGEWTTRFDIPHAQSYGSDNSYVVVLGLALLALIYLTAITPSSSSMPRVLLVILGTIAILPLVVLASVWDFQRHWPDTDLRLPAACLFLLLPLVLAWWLRRHEAWKNAIWKHALAAAWLFLLGVFRVKNLTIALEAWCALGSIGLVAWGVAESRSERINVGITGFALSIVFFYFTDVMDKIDRSFSLILLGVLFLAGGWALEKARRRLIAGIAGASA